jgi:hypothetical protein
MFLGAFLPQCRLTLRAVRKGNRLAACCTCRFYGFFVEKSRKNHDLWDCFCSLQGKKSPCGRFLEVLCAKCNKLPGGNIKAGMFPVDRARKQFCYAALPLFL